VNDGPRALLAASHLKMRLVPVQERQKDHARLVKACRRPKNVPRKLDCRLENFLKYVDAGHYDGGRFHRTVRMDNQPANKVKIEVVQAGVDPNKEKAGFAPIKLERTNQTGLHHENGTLSMARDGPDTATSDFFICIGPQPSLDYEGKRNPDGQGFAAFGRVVKGMDIVRKVQASTAEEQKLTPPIKILKIRRKS